MRAGGSQRTAVRTDRSDAESVADIEPAPAVANDHALDDDVGAPSSIGARIVLVLVLLAATAGLGWWVLRDRSAPTREPSTAAVTVRVATAERRDVPMWIAGIGSVRAFNTVTVRARVGGELLSVDFVEGQDVSAGDVLARIDPRQFEIARDQAQAKLAQDQAQLANARAELEASRSLASGKYESKLMLATNTARVSELSALVDADRAAVRSAKLQLEYATIVAPISGRTGLRRLDRGNIVRADDTEGLVVIAQLSPISVVFTLPQARLPDVMTGLRAQAHPPVRVVGPAGSVLAEGELLVVDNEIDPTTGTFSLKATFVNADRTLWPGQFVDARLQLGTRAAAIVVPSAAVQPGAEGPMVYVVGDDDVVQPRTVESGATVDGITVVERGLEAGERVVIEGQFKLRAGTTVDPRDDGA